MSRQDSQLESAARATVMLVDDEELVTASLGSFLRFESNYEVVTFQSPFEALRHLKEGPVDIVISDFLMPEMDGLQLLQEVKTLYPFVPCVLLTGYADKANAIKAINEVGLYQYIEKPWDNDQLIMIIRNGIRSKNVNETLAQKILQLDRALLERDKLVKSADLMQRELEMAGRFQRQMLPDKLPCLNGLSIAVRYQPAIQIGGDFYDTIELSGGRQALLLADATGHGIQASLSTALLKFAFASFAGTDVSGDDILPGINSVLYKSLPSDIFVASLVVVIDSKERRKTG